MRSESVEQSKYIAGCYHEIKLLRRETQHGSRDTQKSTIQRWMMRVYDRFVFASESKELRHTSHTIPLLLPPV